MGNKMKQKNIYQTIGKYAIGLVLAGLAFGAVKSGCLEDRAGPEIAKGIIRVHENYKGMKNE